MSVLALVCDVSILRIAWMARSTEGLVSPWDVLPAAVLGAFCLSAFLIGYAAIQQDHESWLTRMAAVIHVGVWTGIGVIVYRYGFGFDQVLHQASERALREQGSIHLPSVLYIGQYVLVAGLSWVTRIDTQIIDTCLAPGLFISGLFFLAHRLRAHRPWAVVACVMPLTLLNYGTFTVPWHVGMACVVWIMGLLAQESRSERWGARVMACVALSIHPLAGIPALMTTVRRWRLACAGIVLGIAGAMVWLIAHGRATWVGASVEAWHEAWYAMMAHPYTATLGWDVLSWIYRGWFVWPWIMTGIGIYGIRKYGTPHLTPLIGVLCGVSVSAWFLAGGVRFVDILPAEQFEFALRLWRSAPIWVLPGILLVVDAWLQRRMIVVCVVGAVLAPIGWFLAYPQHNNIVPNVAPSIGESDVLIAHDIRRLIEDAHVHAFFAPQMVSAAYIREYGFGEQIQTVYGERNVYALPTGGELYGLYTELFSSTDTRAVAQKMQQAVRTQPIALVIPRAWDAQNRLDTFFAAERISPVEQEYRVYVIR